MNKSLLLRVATANIVLSLLITLYGCCHYPKARVSHSTGTIPLVATVTLVAYGDTRTGPWGLGDNAKQSLHGKVVDDILEHDGPIDGVLFTGDAVMSNFPLWRKDYWRCFLSQSDRFRKAKIPFYPSLGNHEVLSPIVPLIKTTALSASESGTHLMAEQDMGKRVADAYEAGEMVAANPPVAPEAVMETIDPNTKRGQTLLKQWERSIAKGDAVSAHQFGQFEGHLQRSFYDLPAAKDERCAANAKTFSDNYPHVLPHMQEEAAAKMEAALMNRLSL